jgi:hypothetical protein
MQSNSSDLSDAVHFLTILRPSIASHEDFLAPETHPLTNKSPNFQLSDRSAARRFRYAPWFSAHLSTLHSTASFDLGRDLCFHLNRLSVSCSPRFSAHCPHPAHLASPFPWSDPRRSPQLGAEWTCLLEARVMCGCISGRPQHGRRCRKLYHPCSHIILNFLWVPSSVRSWSANFQT